MGRLSVTNNGQRAALLIEGELLEGGQQHRTSARDVVLGPGESRDIDTYCVEAGRWEAGKTARRRQARRAPLTVRSELSTGISARRHGGGQERIWDRVRRFDAARRPSATSSLLDHLDRQGAPSSHRYDAALPQPLEGQRGVVLGLGAQPLLLEVFGTATLFRRHYRQLLEATLLDLELLPPHMALPAPMPGQRARDFAAAVGSLGFGGFDGGPGGIEIRDHRVLKSRNVLSTRGAVTADGIAVALPQRQPDLAHLTSWNTIHHLMEMA